MNGVRYVTEESPNHPFSIEQLLDANSDAPLAPADVLALLIMRVGQTITLHGFVGAETKITRVQ